jgi:hypothetical protein
MISFVYRHLEIALISWRIAASILELGSLDPLTGGRRATLYRSELKTVVTIRHQRTHHIPEISDETTAWEDEDSKWREPIDGFEHRREVSSK